MDSQVIKVVKNKNEHGIAIVEFSMVAVVFLGLLGLMLDVGVGMYRHSVLTHATAHTIREVTAKRLETSEGEDQCDISDLEDRAVKEAYKYMADTYGFPTPRHGDDDHPVLKFSPKVMPVSDPENESGVPMLKITGEWDFNCSFCIFMGKKTITTESSGFLEFSCPGVF